MSDDEYESWDTPLRRQTVPWTNNNINSTRGIYRELDKKIIRF